MVYNKAKNLNGANKGLGLYANGVGPVVTVKFSAPPPARARRRRHAQRVAERDAKKLANAGGGGGAPAPIRAPSKRSREPSPAPQPGEESPNTQAQRAVKEAQALSAEKARNKKVRK